MAYLLTKRRRNPETGRTEVYYRVGWREGGKQRTEALGFLAHSEARKLLVAKEAELLRAAAVPPPPTEPASPRRSVRQLLRDRLLVHLRARGLAPSTIAAAEYAVASLERLLGDVLVADLNGVHGDGYVVARRGEGRSAKTIRNEIQVLRQALGLAVEDGDIAAVPTLHRPRKERARPVRFLTPAQSEQLLVSALAGDDPLSGLAIALAVEVGPRRGEVLTRGWEDVDWETSSVHVRAKPSIGWRLKTGDARVVPLSPGLVELLREAWVRAGRPPTGWIFPSPADPMRPRGNFRRALATACRRAELPTMNPHALRHTFASRMAGRGVPRVVTAAVGGWSPTSSVLAEVYEHAIPAHVRAAVAEGSLLPSAATLEAERAKVLPLAAGQKRRPSGEK